MTGPGRLATILALGAATCAAAASACFALSRDQASGNAKADPDEALSRAFSQLTSTVGVAQDRPATAMGAPVVYDLSAPRGAREQRDGDEQLRTHPSDPAFNPFMASPGGKAASQPDQ